MAVINISNVINVSVIAAPSGLAPYSVNNLALFTDEEPLTELPEDYQGYQIYSSASDVAIDWGVGSKVHDAALAVFSQSPNILSGGGLFIVLKMESEETLAAALTRAQGLVFFGGAAFTMSLTDAQILAAGVVAQAARKLLFVVSGDAGALLSPSGLFYSAKAQGLSQLRGLYYNGSPAQQAAFLFAYASRAMSTNFAATNSASSIHLKQLVGVEPDSTLSQLRLGQAKDVGADVYANIAGRPSVLCYGANSFFDDVFNLNWFVGAIEVAGFNFLAGTGTKIPQTEQGLDALKGAYQSVAQQAVANAFVAPGEWKLPDTFGKPEDFKRNIQDFGYYIWSAPIASQPQAERDLRKSPVVRIAIKYSGAIHTSDVIVAVNR